MNTLKRIKSKQILKELNDIYCFYIYFLFNYIMIIFLKYLIKVFMKFKFFINIRLFFALLIIRFSLKLYKH